MPTRSRTAYVLGLTSVLLALVAGPQAVSAQEDLPNPRLSIPRSATTANGGIEREWEYHKPANAAKFRTKYTPISIFAGGSGYCTPPSHPDYYGYDTGGCRRSNCFGGSRSRDCR